jgi:DNA-binding transcriptional regulator YiaG
MVVANVDSGYAAVDADIINKHILNDKASRVSITAYERQHTLRETFQVMQPTSLSGDSDFIWDFIATNASGGILVKGKSVSKFDVQSQVPSKANQISYASKLEFIKDTFDLTNEQLAKVVGSTRKTVHNWSTGLNKPNRNKAKRVLELNGIAKLWINRGFTADRDSLLVQGQTGETLMELLSNDNLDTELVMFHGSSMHIDNLNDIELEDPFA